MEKALANLPPQRHPVTIRVDTAVLERVRSLLGELAAEHPTFRLTVSDALRLALYEGVKLLEARYRPAPKNKTGSRKNAARGGG